MRIVCWQTIFMKYYTLFFFFFFLKIRKDVAKFVIRCSCDWRFKGSFKLPFEYQELFSHLSRYPCISPLYSDGFFNLTWYNKFGMVYCTYLGVSVYNLKKNIVLFCLKIFFFTFTNSVDPNEMQHDAAFHLGLHCSQKYPFEVSAYT